ncbi:hypothetical protein [Sphingomonas sp. VDB2]|uniref:hypothetical protein n=1 Tax=Sphingomonas sp. VDB2 TaxID=3228751 RepID=UPI003A804223
MAGLLLMMSAEASARNRPGVPVTINYGRAIVVSDKLSNAVFFGIMRSNVVTINVDGETVLIANIDKTAGNSDGLRVTYFWKEKFLFEKEYDCRERQPAACGRKIVRGVEDASRHIKF